MSSLKATHWFLSAAVCATVPTQVQAANHYPDPAFLSKRALDIRAILSPPPPPDSPEARADFARILEYQATRAPRDVARAAFVVDVKLDTLFGPTWGPLTAREVAAWSELFELVRIDTDYFVQETKKRWGRPRPYVANPAVQPAVHKEWTNAYPSGHAAISRTFARLLSKMDPSRASAFQARAEEIAEDRVRSGLHHPTDIEAGKKLGDAVFDLLWKDLEFQRRLSRLISTAM